MSDSWREVGASRYVSLTTFRKDGRAVSTPVWIAPEGSSLVVTTERSSGKAKRLRNDPTVRLQPCSVRGRVAPGAVLVEARCAVLGPQDDAGPAEAALRRKYGLQFRAFLLVEALVHRLRRTTGDRVLLRITP